MPESRSEPGKRASAGTPESVVSTLYTMMLAGGRAGVLVAVASITESVCLGVTVLVGVSAGVSGTTVDVGNIAGASVVGLAGVTLGASG